MTKKMFKVISPIERRDGGKWWMRCGTAHGNKDDSINVYVDALPLAGMAAGKGITLQLREYTEEELRERSERANNPRGGSSMGPSSRDAGPSDSIPF